MASNEALAQVFAALGDPTRLKLVAVLCAGGAFSISHLTETTEISRQGVTKHLNVLAEAGVVRDVKMGRERLWQLEPARIDEARRTLESIGREWELALGRLKELLINSLSQPIIGKDVDERRRRRRRSIPGT
jgi:DNA-binding transcriptional ArsR family regulator